MKAAADKALRAQLVKELQRRSTRPGTDVRELIEDFQEPGAGGRLLVSEGEGEVALWVPVPDGYEGPHTVEVAPRDNPGQVLDRLHALGEVELSGVGRFQRFVLSPLSYKQATQAAKGERPTLMLRGEGPDGNWSPLGFDDTWFDEDLLLLTDLAVRGGVEVRPDVEVGPKDPDWKRLGPKQRDALEQVAGRRLPGVLHADDLKTLLAQAGKAQGAVSGALEGLSALLTPEAAASGAKAKKGAGKAEAKDAPPPPSAAETKAREALLGVLGEGAFSPGEYPEGLVEVAVETLSSLGATEPLKVARGFLAEEDTDEAALQEALDRAFGSGFSETRTPTLGLLDAVLDGRPEALGFSGVGSLRALREELELRAEAELFGQVASGPALRTEAADQKLLELTEHLAEGTGLEPAQVHPVAVQVLAWANGAAPRPPVLILSGEPGTGVDTLFTRVQALLGEGASVRGSTDLRYEDPVGALVGSPTGRAARGSALLTSPDAETGATLYLDGAEAVGQASGGDEQKAAQENLWGFLAQARRDGWFRGYAQGQTVGDKVPFRGAVIRTSDGVGKLRDAMPPEVWAQLSAGVVDLGSASAASVRAQLTASLEKQIVSLGQPDAKVELSDGVVRFVDELHERGMKPAELLRLAEDAIAPRLFFSGLEGGLSPKVRIDFARGLTPREQAKVRDGWLEGKPVSLPGLGASPFVVYDEGAFESVLRAALDPTVKAGVAESGELDELRALLADYQLGADVDARRIQELARRSEAAEGRVAQVQWMNERALWQQDTLRRLNTEAQKTIHKLQGDVAKANDRIDTLNDSLAELKGSNEVLLEQARAAVKERDAVAATLRAVEEEFEQAIRSLGMEAGHGGARRAFDTVIRLGSKDAHNRYSKALLQQMFTRATEQALGETASLQRMNGKWGEIGQLALGYLRAAEAVGEKVDPTVIYIFESAARLSGGNGYSNDLAGDWARMGLPSQYGPGQNPGRLSQAARELAGRFGIRF